MGGPRYRRGDVVRLSGEDGTVLSGIVEVVDFRGYEKRSFKGCEWSYDVYIERDPASSGGPCIYKHVPECDVFDGSD